MQKYLLVLITIAICTPAAVFGQSTNADCSMVDSADVDINIFKITAQDAGIDYSLLPEDAQERVSKNLRAYCCDQNILKEVTCSKTKTDIPPDWYYPQSTYLFDHMIDVILRRLDGNPDLIYPDVALDPIGKEWREKVRELASDPAWTTPLLILNTAKPYWIDKDASLLWLYNKVCKSAYDIYTKKFTGQEWITNTPGALPTSRSQSVCDLLVEQRIQYELKYISVLINTSANRTLENYMQKHLSNYFATTRLSQLQSTIAQMVDAFQTVNRFIVEWTKQCSM